MAEVRDMDALIPEDIEYSFRGETYHLPGDIDVEHTYRILDLLQKAAAIEDAALEAAKNSKPVDFDERKRNDEAIAAVLLELFQQRDESLTDLPFGVLGNRQVLADVLISLGFEFVPVGGDASPPVKARNQSGRSSSSRRSSKSSASRTRKS